MPDELKSERVTTMMTPSEVRAIDDWSFQQRIRSRGEAIRRLIQLGLAAQQQSKTAQPLTTAQTEAKEQPPTSARLKSP